MKRSYKALVMLGIGAVVAAAAFAATGFAGSEDSKLLLVAGPVPFVEEGGAGFTVAKLDNKGPSTVTQAVLQVDFMSSPVVTIVAPVDPSCHDAPITGGVRVSCTLPQVPAGTKISRVIRWTAPQIATSTPPTVLTMTAGLAYKNDPNNNSLDADPVTTTILNGSNGPADPGSNEVDVDSSCGNPSAATNATTGLVPTAADPQMSTLGYGADQTLGFPCNWAVVGETGIDPDSKCGSTSPCSTGFWFASLPNALGELTLRIYELPRGTTLSKFVLREFAKFPDDVTNSLVVPLCVNGAPPPTEPPGEPPFSCELPNSREKLGSRGAIFHLKVQGTLRDPGYAG